MIFCCFLDKASILPEARDELALSHVIISERIARMSLAHYNNATGLLKYIEVLQDNALRHA
jgi:hypothetical protein